MISSTTLRTSRLHIGHSGAAIAAHCRQFMGIFRSSARQRANERPRGTAGLTGSWAWAPTLRSHAAASLADDNAAGSYARSVRGVTRRAWRPQPVRRAVTGPRAVLDARIHAHAAGTDRQRAGDADLPCCARRRGTIVKMTRHRCARLGQMSATADNLCDRIALRRPSNRRQQLPASAANIVGVGHG